jgi:AAA+ superfamily predicted ATPase
MASATLHVRFIGHGIGRVPSNVHRNEGGAGVSRINVLVAMTSGDYLAEGIASRVNARADMTLVRARCVYATELESILPSIPASVPCALVLVGRPSETDELAREWLDRRADLVVLQADLVGAVRVAMRDPRLDSLLAAIAGLVEEVGNRGRQRFARFELVAMDAPARPRRLLDASIAWVHSILRSAVARVPEDAREMRTLILGSLDASPGAGVVVGVNDAASTETALDEALAAPDAQDEPLAAADRAFALGSLEFRLLLLTLAPELDHRFQRCFGLLLDDMSRRVGTLALHHALLGLKRGELADGALARWQLFEGIAGRPAAADEPLRLDPWFARWLLGERDALGEDPLVRRAVRTVQWGGAGLMQRNEESDRAAELMGMLRRGAGAQWIVLGGDHAAEWRALVVLGASSQGAVPIRVEASRVVGADALDVEECAKRIGRMALLNGDPLVVDAVALNEDGSDDERMRTFLAALGATGCCGIVVARDEARVVRLLGGMTLELPHGEPMPFDARVAALRAAASATGAYLADDDARAMAARYPLQVDGLEHAMRLARSRATDSTTSEPTLARFTMALKDVAAESLSHLAERIEPVFDLDEVVLPADRKEQLVEIVDNIRLAPRVMDEWKFGAQLPYGRGVTALFHGPSGTGKTMAAIGIARRLGIQLLRLELSRMVSKYIGDTEKNIDRVFTDAQRSGSAILIDEADALLGKRSEVKDAHDRYANIEVAYLLQRMETYEGLAILTTNMRQNLDPAFLRRLRFIIDFPRPDVAARERIWRQCLPRESHVLDDAAFRQLARRVDLTGGHIRQVTLRAAFGAAAAGVQIGLEHIAHAARAEFAKLGMPPAELDLSSSRKAA